MQKGLEAIIARHAMRALVARQGSAFVIYTMDHLPQDWHDLASHHDFAWDERLRQEVIRRGIFCFPLATKQWSLSAAHSADDVKATLTAVEESIVAIESGAMKR
jgi:glutamate-1-semialdehyde 2,1-aminomutase